MFCAFEILCFDVWIELIVSVDELEIWEPLYISFDGPLKGLLLVELTA